MVPTGSPPPPSPAFAQFDALFRHAPFGVALFDRALRYVRVNDALAAFDGRPAAEHLGRTPREVVPAFGEVMEAALRGVFATGAPSEVIEGEVALPERPGERRALRVRFFPVEEGGAVTHAGGALIDVTEQRRAQDVLHASERQLREVVEAAPSGIVMVDADGRIVLVNRQVERLFGYGREELLGQPVDVLVPEAVRATHGRNRAAFGEAPAARAMGAGRDLHGRRKDGSTFPLEIGLTPVETPEGPAVLATVVDITERKRVEEALRESEAETRRLALVAARTTNGVVMTDTQGRVEWANEAFIRLSGYTLGELRGRRPGELLQGPDTDAATTARVRESVLAREPFAAELRNYRKDGVPFWVRVEATPLFEDGAFAGYITIQSDVTERKEAEAALRASEERYRTFVSLSQEGVFRFEVDVPIDTAAPAEQQVERMLRGGVLAECNDAYARMYGYERAEDLIGARLDEFLPPDEPRTRAYLHAFVDEGYRLTEAESFEHDRDGVLRVFSNDLVGVVEGGRVVRAWGTQRDVTGRVLAEAARRESEAALQLALDVAQMGTWAVDLPGRQVRRSASTDRLFGFPADGAPRNAADFLARVHPDDRERADRMLRGTLRSGEGVAVEFRIVRPDGEARWLSARGALERDASGQPARLVGAFVDVTDRVRAEEALRASEERFRTISELTSDFAYSARLLPDGAFEREWVIGAYERITGYAPEETGPRDAWRGVVHPDDLALGEAHRARFLAGETAVSEHRILRKDGAVRWIRDITRPVLDAEGRVVGAVGAAQDVTAQREAEAAAAAAARQNEQVLESIDDAFYALDRDWRFTYVNSRTEALFGRPRQDLLGRTLWEEYPHNVGTAYWEHYHRALETGAPASFDTYAERVGVHFAVRVFPFEQGLSVYFRDVTAEKRAAEALRASEERLRLALEGGAMGTWEWDLTTDVLAVDRREAALIGRPPEELATVEAFLALVLPEDLGGLREALGEAIEGAGDYAHEFRILRPDGEARWLAGRGRVLRDADGRPIRMFGLNFDITERRRAEEELRRQTREMEQFTYTVSHDLKSPIVTVTGFLGLLEAHVEAGRAEEAKSAAVRIRRAAERMSRLTDDLLELSRIGRLSGERREVDVSALVEELADAQGPQTAATGCTIAVQPDMPHLRADPRRLGEAFDNLLANAVKYACPGGATRIEVRAEEADGEVRYVVADDGPGIAPEHHERIFEVFQRGTSGADGTGMGLAIVRKIMEVHEGRVWVESAPGEGARFVLAFPRQAVVAEPPAA